MSDPAVRLRFGRFEMLPAQRQLLAEGTPVILGARAFDLLHVLIENRHRVVPKDELLDLAWPGLVVEEGNLKVQVSGLRKVIGPAAIATVPARGYRFALTLQDAAAAREPTREAVPHPAATRGTIPRSARRMIGRDDELVALQAAVQQERLISVVGAGGIGKTTLALAAASAMGQAGTPIVWVDLTEVRESSAVLAAIAHASGVVPGAGSDLQALVVGALASRRVLLVIDNAEHLIEGVAAQVRRLLDETADLRILVTTQAPLQLLEEHVFRIASLEVPMPGTPLEEALEYGAIALFAGCAMAQQRSFRVDASNLSAIIDICFRLDGLALAIELAAGRVPLLGVHGLRQRLGERLRLLSTSSRSAPSRQATLQAAFDWSYGLLAKVEQQVFRHLAVFSGGFTLELAAKVAAQDELDSWAVIDVLGSLVDRSLVAADDGDPPRYRLLESARAYALQAVAACGERDALLRRHADAMLEGAELCERSMWVTTEAAWKAQWAPEIDNMRAALDWSSRHAPAQAVGIAGASFHLFSSLALLHEIRQRSSALDAALSQLDVSESVEARFLLARSLQMRDVAGEAQHTFAMRAAQTFRQAGNAQGLFEALVAVTNCFQNYRGDATAALAEMERVEDSAWPAALRALGWIARSKVALIDERLADNRKALEMALELSVSAGSDRITSVALANLADHVLGVGGIDEAVHRGEELVRLLTRMQNRAALPLALGNLANALLQQGSTKRARVILGDAFSEMKTQSWSWIRGFGDVYALLASRESRLEDAAMLIGWADQTRKTRGARQRNEERCRALVMADLACVNGEVLLDQQAIGARMTVEQIVLRTLNVA